VVIDVAAALIHDARGRYLITRRRPGSHLAGLWEFPGGKRRPDETLAECLARELAEELGAEFQVGALVETVVWTYPEKTVALHFYECRLITGTITAREAQEMAWVEPSRFDLYDFPPPDQAVLERLRRPA
jgi:8-oxo-dGTP diphosphatase